MTDADENTYLAIVRAEVSQLYLDEFSDNDDFVRDLRIASDDLSEIAMAVERRLGIRIPDKDYKNVHSVRTYVNIIAAFVAQRRLGP